MKAYLEIEMPRCCNKCPMLVYEGHVLCICRALPAIEEGEILKPWKNRRKDCPLIPVPPHGDLIDRDKLKEQLEYVASLEWNQRVGASPGIECAIDMLDDAQTIIPAEDGEK